MRRKDQQQRARTVDCAGCGSSSGLYWRGWRAYRVDDPKAGGPPELAFYCPACSRRDFSIKC